MIAYQVNIEKIPDNCLDCPCCWCNLPMCCNKHEGITDKVKKPYLTKRHKECPLIEVGGK